MAESTLLYLKDNPYVWAIILLITTIIGLLGIILNRRNKSLFYVVNSNYIISKKETTIDNLTIKYDAEEIDSLTITKIALVNNGNTTISNDDIAKASPIKIVGDGECKILSASILVESNKSNLFEVSIKDQNSVNIDFDYIDKKDGVLLQLIHTGSKRSLDYQGKIKGGKIASPYKDNYTIIRKVFIGFFAWPNKTIFIFWYVSVLFTIYILLGLSVLFGILDETIILQSNETPEMFSDFWIPYIIVLSMYLPAWFLTFTQMKKRRFMLPKAFRDYFN